VFFQADPLLRYCSSHARHLRLWAIRLPPPLSRSIMMITVVSSGCFSDETNSGNKDEFSEAEVQWCLKDENDS
jgi:hypothetical protein